MASIHRAVIQALHAPDFESMCRGAVAEWPAMLGVDCAVIALKVGMEGFRIDRNGIAHLDASICERSRRGLGGAIMRTVGPPDMHVHTMAMPHLMFYAPYTTDADIGGSVGIHGTDKPDKNRRGVDWTWGCVSVDNEAIDELNRLLPLGTPVVIEN